MQDLYPDIFRFTVSLFPSNDDDVVTSPYNAMLALNELVEHASAVLPIENQALLDIVAMVEDRMQRSSSKAASGAATNLLGKGVCGWWHAHLEGVSCAVRLSWQHSGMQARISSRMQHPS